MDNLVSVLILNWNKTPETIRAIESVLTQTYNNVEVVVLDNGSTDKSLENEISKKFEGIKFVQLDKNYGCPGGRNRAIKYCKGEFIFFCDNDGVLHKDALRNALETILKDETIGIVTGQTKQFTSEAEIDFDFSIDHRVKFFTSQFQGGICLHRKDNFKRIGYYPDDYIYGAEESFLSLKLLDIGYTIVKDNGVILWHQSPHLQKLEPLSTVRRWGNVLRNAYQLYPLECFLLFVFYFFTVYFYFAHKIGILWQFAHYIPVTLKSLSNYKRSPVKRRTFINYMKLGHTKHSQKYSI